MGYCDFTDAELRELTRQRRRERNSRRLKDFGATIRVSADTSMIAFDWTKAWPCKEGEKGAVFKSIRRATTRARRRTIAADRQRYVKPPSRSHGTLSERVFGALWNSQGGRCYLCSRDFHVDDWATLDHVIPRALGGADGGNILLACSKCNNRKGSRAPAPCEMIYLAAVNAGFTKAFEALESS